jgi:hypothetical protein
MIIDTRKSLAGWFVLAIALGLTSGCKDTNDAAQANATPSATTSGSSRTASVHSLSSGTTISVKLGSTISSKTASVGDAWNGTLASNVDLSNGGVIPAGSSVRGVVAGAVAAEHGNRAMLELAVKGINVNGRDESVTASSEPVIAGSPRARNLGAIAGGAAAGALIGKAVGGDGKDAAVGGVLGGAVAAGAVARSKGYQVVLNDGTVMSFTVQQNVSMR